MNPLLEVHGLCKRYPIGGASSAGRQPWWRRGAERRTPMLHAVDGVDFTLNAGESLGLVGESGCGKSTLARLLARLIDPTEGRIRFAGEDIGAIPASRFGRSPRRGQIQVVFQDPHGSLNPRCTAFDAIADPLRRLAPPQTRAERRTRVAELAALVGLPAELLGRFPHQLSGGQKARVNIARAIAVNPRLLILDEPTSALDVSVQAVILHLLADLREKLGTSYLFVSHDLNVVRLLCDRVMVMYLGKLVETGPAEALFGQARHPYTRALISAIPSSDAALQARRPPLTGEPRSPIDPDPSVCRFHGRCPQGTQRCREVMPILEPAAAIHRVACHYPGP